MLRPGRFASPAPARTSTSKLSSPKVTSKRRRICYAGTQSIPATGLSPARHAALWAANEGHEEWKLAQAHICNRASTKAKRPYPADSANRTQMWTALKDNDRVDIDVKLAVFERHYASPSECFASAYQRSGGRVNKEKGPDILPCTSFLPYRGGTGLGPCLPQVLTRQTRDLSALAPLRSLF